MLKGAAQGRSHLVSGGDGIFASSLLQVGHCDVRLHFESKNRRHLSRFH